MPLAVIIIGRDLLLSLSALYFRYASLPPPVCFTTFWVSPWLTFVILRKPSAGSGTFRCLQRKSNRRRSARSGLASVSENLFPLIPPTNTVQHLLAARSRRFDDVSPDCSGRSCASLDRASVRLPQPPPRATLTDRCRWTVGATTIWSGLSYVFSKDAIRYLK